MLYVFASPPPGWPDGLELEVVPPDAPPALWPAAPVLVPAASVEAFAEAAEVYLLKGGRYPEAVLLAPPDQPVPSRHAALFDAVLPLDRSALRAFDRDPESLRDQWLADEAVLTLEDEGLVMLAAYATVPESVLRSLPERARERAERRPSFAKALRTAATAQLDLERALSSPAGERGPASDLLDAIRNGPLESAAALSPLERALAPTLEGVAEPQVLTAWAVAPLETTESKHSVGPAPTDQQEADRQRALLALLLVSALRRADLAARTHRRALRGSGGAKAGEPDPEALLELMSSRGLRFVDAAGDRELEVGFDPEANAFRIGDLRRTGRSTAERVVAEFRSGTSTLWTGEGEGEVVVPVSDLVEALEAGADALVLRTAPTASL